MKQCLLIVSIFVFEGVALWGMGEKAGLRRHYDRFMNYPVNEKSAAVKINGNVLTANVDSKCYGINDHNHKPVK